MATLTEEGLENETKSVQGARTRRRAAPKPDNPPAYEDYTNALELHLNCSKLYIDHNTNAYITRFKWTTVYATLSMASLVAFTHYLYTFA